MTPALPRTALTLPLIAAEQAGDDDAIVSLLAISQPDIRRYAWRALALHALCIEL